MNSVKEVVLRSLAMAAAVVCMLASFSHVAHASGCFYQVRNSNLTPNFRFHGGSWFRPFGPGSVSLATDDTVTIARFVATRFSQGTGWSCPYGVGNTGVCANLDGRNGPDHLCSITVKMKPTNSQQYDIYFNERCNGTNVHVAQAGIHDDRSAWIVWDSNPDVQFAWWFGIDTDGPNDTFGGQGVVLGTPYICFP